MTDFFDKMQLKVKRKDKGKRGTWICMHLIVNTPLCAQVWHAFSRDLTVLLAHPAFIR